MAGTPSSGGSLISTTVLGASFIDLLRSASVIFDLGATVLRDLNGNTVIPRQTGGASGFWVAENSAPTESQLTVDQVLLMPKTVGAFTDFSRRLALQSSVDVEMMVRRDLSGLLAEEMEKAAVQGSGAASQPLGLLSMSGLGAVVGGANGAAPTWDMLVDLQAAVLNSNVPIDNCAWLMNPKTRAKLLKTQQFSGTSGTNVYQAAQAIGRTGVSTHVPNDLTKGTSAGVCSALFYGDFANIVIGMWGGLDLLLDPYTGSTSGTKRIVAMLDCDIGVRRAAAFALCKDVLTS